MAQRGQPFEGRPFLLSSRSERWITKLNESSDMLDVDHNAVWNDSWIAAWFGNGPGKSRNRHAAYLSVPIKYRSATHASQTCVLHDVAVICPIINHGLCGIDDKAGSPVTPYVPAEAALWQPRDSHWI